MSIPMTNDRHGHLTLTIFPGKEQIRIGEDVVLRFHRDMLAEIERLRNSVTVLQKSNDLYRESFGETIAELERLRAIVDKLPKTADGVPMHPGAIVWTNPGCPDDPQKTMVTSVINFVACGAPDGEQSIRTPLDDCCPDCDEGFQASECYSTRAAAEAALTAKLKKEGE